MLAVIVSVNADSIWVSISMVMPLGGLSELVSESSPAFVREFLACDIVGQLIGWEFLLGYFQPGIGKVRANFS